jgi:rhodanese-related sulfurtransferase
MPKTAEDLVNEALALVRTLSVAEAQALHAEGVQMIDLRDPRELDREGLMPGAFSAPRGMLEFWVDPSCKYYNAKVFTDRDKPYVVFCAGGWRSALAARTMLEMGYTNVMHIHGGFTDWKAAGAPVTMREPRPAAAAPKT